MALLVPKPLVAVRVTEYVPRVANCTCGLREAAVVPPTNVTPALGLMLQSQLVGYDWLLSLSTTVPPGHNSLRLGAKATCGGPGQSRAPAGW